MIKPKLKECDACHKQAVIWKNHEGFKYIPRENNKFSDSLERQAFLLTFKSE
jgi:hypothetical protein